MSYTGSNGIIFKGDDTKKNKNYFDKAKSELINLLLKSPEPMEFTESNNRGFGLKDFILSFYDKESIEDLRSNINSFIKGEKQIPYVDIQDVIVDENVVLIKCIFLIEGYDNKNFEAVIDL